MAENDQLIGRVLADRYRVDARLARGGMARVYRAHDLQLDREVAVKVLAAPYAEDAAYVTRFLVEARTAASLSHPNLAHVYDAGSDGDRHFIVMELLGDYRSLREVLETERRLPAPDAVAMVQSLLAGLGQLHEHGLVHCDVKPGNVLIAPAGVKLIDFGIARPSHEPSAGATSIGSLHAMSPEQLRGEALTPESDLFATGVLLYEALTGRVPFPGDTAAEVAARHRAGPPPPPEAAGPGGPRLDAVVMQALQLDPARRFHSAAAMNHALELAMADDPTPQPADDEDETTTFVVQAPPPAAYQVPGAPIARGGSLGGALAVLAGIGLAVAVVGLVVMLGLRPGDGDGTGAPSASPSASPRATVPTGSVRIPDTIGMTEEQAEQAAGDAGLNWRIEWQVVPNASPGIYDQEPAPDTLVEPGSRFVMYAYRTE
jgi:tRNA A-37 threonylcarbamoyl transferase component Bud32